jgi:hypothetical protein
MAFSVIYVPAGLPQVARRRGRVSGPPAVMSRREIGQLLASASFLEITETDVTAAYRRTQQAWLDEWTTHADELAARLTAELVAERQNERRNTLAAIDDGLLKRAILTARRR